MRKTGRIIWYATAIFLSGLVMLLSVVGIAGTWIAERALDNTVTEVIGVVDNFTSTLRRADQKVDQNLEQMQMVSAEISNSSAQLSQDVTNKGLIQMTLSDQHTQQLTDLGTSLKGSISTFHDILSAGLDLYRLIDRLPLISLSIPNKDQMDKLENSFAAIESSTEALNKNITDFRSGVGDRIGMIQTGADSLNEQLGQSRDQLARLDTRLVAVQEDLDRLQQSFVKAFVLVSILVTLLLAWVIYSQFSVLFLFRLRWKEHGNKPS